MSESIFTVAGMISLLTLVVMEIVLGIDNIIFISILCGKLPEKEQEKTRKLGLILALVFRVALLFGITWIIGFKEPWVSLLGVEFSGKDFILLGGGLFLIYKSTVEIHEKVEGADEGEELASGKKRLTMSSAILQIIFLDIVFSFDSILTAVGMVQDNITIMITAVVISMIVMMFFAKPVSSFVNRHPTVKMLALSFLLMIGMMLIAEALHFHVPKGYIYFAMAFSMFVELLNMRYRKKKVKAKS
jgi:predicted tellurium resistance membrane protein TerC